MSLNSDHLKQILKTLNFSLQGLSKMDLSYLDLEGSDERFVEYDMYRSASVKSFELALETAGKLLRKTLTPYLSSKKEAWSLTYKDLFRRALQFNLIDTDCCERWFTYRDSRNSAAHDYGEHFAEETLKLLPSFIKDCEQLIEVFSRD